MLLYRRWSCLGHRRLLETVLDLFHLILPLGIPLWPARHLDLPFHMQKHILSASVIDPRNPDTVERLHLQLPGHVLAGIEPLHRSVDHVVREIVLREHRIDVQIVVLQQGVGSGGVDALHETDDCAEVAVYDAEVD